ncbi:unnamed protein product [Rotaria sp. Silwood1]|nr:unnamed protein product [Rotaria sp. Silwood1]CAF1580029.1 unnamed protein product [Rotaria sp. Silwood1]
MATSVHSNSVSYSSSSNQHLPTRNVVLHKRPDHSGFGIYIGEDFPTGIYIVTVERNSPASDANIQPGDHILAINGQLVSSMTKNPKEILCQAATNSETLELTIQSTDIFQTLDIPLINSYKNNENNHKQQKSSQQTFDKNTDLENYIKSILGNENIQLVPLPDSLQNNEFILRSDTYPISSKSKNLNSYPTYASHSKGHGEEHRHHHHHHHRRSKRKLVETKQTQTSMDDSQDENISQEQPSTALLRQYPVQPSMGTSYRMLRTQQFNSNDNPINESNDPKTLLNNKSSDSIIITSTDTTVTPVSQPDKITRDTTATIRPPQTQHMADIVEAAVAASRNNRELAKKPEEISTRQPVEIPKQTATPPPYQPTDPINQRSTITTAPVQNQNPPLPPYTPTAQTYPSPKPTNNRENTNEGTYNVRNAQQNRPEIVSSPPNENKIPPTIRGEGVRTVHLHRSDNYEGFGFHLQYNKTYFLVHKIENDSPAAGSGLRIDDVVLSVNQQSTENMPHGTFVKLVGESSDVDFIVQPREEYLRVNIRPKLNAQQTPTPSILSNNNSDNTRKTGLSKALSKLTNR